MSLLLCRGFLSTRLYRVFQGSSPAHTGPYGPIWAYTQKRFSRQDKTQKRRSSATHKLKNASIASTRIIEWSLATQNPGFLVSWFWIMVSGVWFLASGFWCLVSEYRFMGSGVWFLVSDFWILDSGFWFLISGLWCLVSGFWFLSPEVGGTYWRILGEPGGGCQQYRCFETKSKNPLGKPSWGKNKADHIMQYKIKQVCIQKTQWWAKVVPDKKK